IKPMHPTRFTGTYEVTIEGQTYTLELEQGRDISGHLSDGEEQVDIARVSSDTHEIRFVANMEAFGRDGVYRFTLQTHSRDSLTGSYTNPRGDEYRVRAERQGELEERSTQQAEAGSVDYISELSFPN
ncbi:hypothetical protein HZZ02_23490, partial [Streptococcus danieliae]|nr:hypothetical protein [Streptococcus danieliae]